MTITAAIHATRDRTSLTHTAARRPVLCYSLLCLAADDNDDRSNEGDGNHRQHPWLNLRQVSLSSDASQRYRKCADFRRTVR